MNHLVAIVGPTAVGKTSLGVSLAHSLGGEIIGADSRQVYRHMDVGTGKPTLEQRRQVRHHLVDVVDPDEPFTLAQYLELAKAALDDIWSRGKLPFLVGGTGLYIWALLEGWEVPRVPPTPALRRGLGARAASDDGSLYRELERLDPASAQTIAPRNIRRVIRALEVCLASGQPFASLRCRQQPHFSSIILGLTTSRAELYRRIDERVEDMVKEGWVEEVKGLLARGYSPELPALSGVGYREMIQYAEGGLGLQEALTRTKYRTHAFARRQYAWFRPGDQRISWLDITSDAEAQAMALVQSDAVSGGGPTGPQ